MQSSGLVVDNNATLLALQDFNADFSRAGISAVLCLIGLVIIAVLSYKKVRGAILIGILATWFLGILAQLVGLYIPNPEVGYYSLYPSWSLPKFDEFGSIFGQCFNLDFSNFRILDFFAIIFAFLFVDLFDTIGTLVGVATKADMLDEDGSLPNAKGALLSDAIGTTAGAVLGTSTVTTFVESSAGVAEGGRTGLTALTTGVLFLASIILSPIFIAIPAFATAAALLYVGFAMFTSILKVDFDDITEAIPAYIAIIAMPLFYSIAEGIALGVIFYVIIKFLTGKKEDISSLMYILALIFLLRYVIA